MTKLIRALITLLALTQTANADYLTRIETLPANSGIFVQGLGSNGKLLTFPLYSASPTWTGVHTFSQLPIITGCTGYLRGTNTTQLTCDSIVAAARLPFPTLATLGGVKATARPANQFVIGIDLVTGDLTFAQPSPSNLSGLGTGVAAALAVNTNTLNGLPTLTTGNKLQVSQIPTATSTLLGGVYIPTGAFLTLAGDGALSLTSGNIASALGYTPANKAGDNFTGNVGFGVPSPSSRLQVAGSGTGTIRVGADAGCGSNYSVIILNDGVENCGNYNLMSGPSATDSNLYINVPTGKSIIFRENNVNRATISAGGSLGVGTPSPNHLLDVNGNVGVAASGYFNFGATDGGGGYGIRDNGGTVEFKNSGGAWVPVGSAGGTTPTSSVRQTVQGGPVDANGLPTFLPASSGSLSITTQNITPSTPLNISGAQGFGANGNSDFITRFTSNQTWSSLTASSTLYLYVNASNGALGFTSLVPVYQFGGTPSVTSNQFTFNISEMKGYMGNGTTAPATPLVFVGEVVTSGSAVTSATAYSYNGYYDSGWINTLAEAGATAYNCNIGNIEYSVKTPIRNLTAQAGYSVGDVVSGHIGSFSTAEFSPLTVLGRLQANVISPGAYFVNNKSTGAGIAITNANWARRIICKRDF